MPWTAETAPGFCRGSDGKALLTTQVHPPLLLQGNTSLRCSMETAEVIIFHGGIIKWFAQFAPVPKDVMWEAQSNAHTVPHRPWHSSGAVSRKLWWEKAANSTGASIGGHSLASTAQQPRVMQMKGETLSRKWELKLFLKAPTRCSCTGYFLLPCWAGCSKLFWNGLLLRGKKTTNQPSKQKKLLLFFFFSGKGMGVEICFQQLAIIFLWNDENGCIN